MGLQRRSKRPRKRKRLEARTPENQAPAINPATAKLDVRGQKSEVRSPRSEAGGLKPEAGGRDPGAGSRTSLQHSALRNPNIVPGSVLHQIHHLVSLTDDVVGSAGVVRIRGQPDRG